ncbi:MAG: double-strand break repair helicase AddA, partial [Phyllobacteriaceae bacterium]|nr:double-strand break repair helicase AddA [Phyllobacteriaceae bacterium]
MDQARDEVRIMTVHAAKGLEAPHVFLVDGSKEIASASQQPAFAVWAEAGGPLAGRDVLVWTKGAAPCAISEALKARREALAGDEYRRLLYVGMTRAKDTLTVCGMIGIRSKTDGKWHASVHAALGGTGHVATLQSPLGFSFMRYSRSGPATGVSLPADKPVLPKPAAPEAFSFAPLPPEPEAPRPFSPSAAA